MEENFNVNKKMFGKKLREARINNNLTQSELAEKIGISQNFLGDIERGIKLPSLSKLVLIANTLKVSLDFLFADSLDNIWIYVKFLDTFFENFFIFMRPLSSLYYILNLYWYKWYTELLTSLFTPIQI